MTCGGGETRMRGSETPQRQGNLVSCIWKTLPLPARFGSVPIIALVSPKDLRRELPSMGICDELLSEWVTALQDCGGRGVMGDSEELVYGQTRWGELEKAGAVPGNGGQTTPGPRTRWQALRQRHLRNEANEKWWRVVFFYYHHQEIQNRTTTWYHCTLMKMAPKDSKDRKQQMLGRRWDNRPSHTRQAGV